MTVFDNKTARVVCAGFQKNRFVEEKWRVSVFKPQLARATLLFLVGALVFVSPAGAEPKNNYATISHFDAATEGSLGVFSLPESLKQIATINGVPILAKEDLPDRLAALQEATLNFPQIFFEFPPKGIILSDRGLGLLPAGLATARASGAYIVLGDGFFSTTGVRGIPVWERPRLLMHEWAHVLQYYYSDISRSEPYALETHSTLMDGWHEATGWEQVDGKWTLPEPHHEETTAYGRTKPIEDQAEALSFMLIGQPGRISPSRVAFLENALDRSINDFTQGTFVPPAGFVPLRKVTSRLETMLNDLIPNSPRARLLIAEDVSDAELLLREYVSDLEQRGLENVVDELSAADRRGIRTYRGEWLYDGQRSLVAALIIPKSDRSVVILRSVKDAD